MAYNPEAWTKSSNELIISLCDSESKSSFKPLMTYPIFGESEQIFGYKDLRIDIAFDAITFKPFVKVKYSERLNDEVEDVQKKLLGFLPENDTIVDDEIKWVDAFSKEQENLPNYDGIFEKIDEYTSKKEDYVVYKTNFRNEYSVKLLKRLQIFVLFFIEAGSYIDTTDLKWDLFFVVKKSDNRIIGFATTYTYLKFDSAQQFDASPEIATRNKISQFIILPIYQNGNHGSQLYEAIVNHWLRNPLVKEITVEDPNEKFDDLRYRQDFKRLFNEGFISKLPDTVNSINRDWFIENAAKKKIEINQFKKLLEIAYVFLKNNKAARLLIKKRLYEKNKDGLDDLDDAIKKDKLQTAYDNYHLEYSNLIKGLRLHENSDDEPVSKRQKV